MTLLGKRAERRLWPEIRRRQDVYGANVAPSERMAWQLRRFNREWRRIVSTTPYYADMKRRNSLPNEFTSWEEFIKRMPATNRSLVQSHREQMTSLEKPPQWWRITSGSTAQPIQMPAWRIEDAATSPNLWLGRLWFGVKPSDRQFLILGPRHLLGSGLKGMIQRRKREIVDWLLGLQRYSAYDVCEEKMRHAGDVMLRFRPNFIVGFSAALDAFARANQDRTSRFHNDLKLKVAIGVAEVFPSPNSEETIARVLGVPVIMSYGSLETDVIAHMTPEGDYQAFWQTYFVEAIDSGISGGKTIRLTSLYPRCFPLVRYELGDEIELDPLDNHGVGVSRFKRVIGRRSDYVELADGSRIHSLAFNTAVSTALSGRHEVTGLQIIQAGFDIRLRVTSSSPLSSAFLRDVQYRLGVAHPLLADIHVDRVESLEQTVAGKAYTIRRR